MRTEFVAQALLPVSSYPLPITKHRIEKANLLMRFAQRIPLARRFARLRTKHVERRSGSPSMPDFGLMGLRSPRLRRSICLCLRAFVAQALLPVCIWVCSDNVWHGVL